MNAATHHYCVTRTLRALEALAARPLSSGELAERIGVHQRTARRLLTSLADEDYATPLGGQRNRYAITARVAAVGAQALLDGVRREAARARPAATDDASPSSPDP
jgi:DNA-binding IclR family transcriptional regulator